MKRIKYVNLFIFIPAGSSLKSGWYLSSLSRFVEDDPYLPDCIDDEDEDTDDLDDVEEEASIIDEEALFLDDDDIIDDDDADEDLDVVGAGGREGGALEGGGWALASSS